MSEPCTAILTDEGIVVRVPYFLRSVLEGVRGRRWDAMERAWVLPATDENVRILSGINGLRFDEALAAMIGAAEGMAESADAAYSDTVPVAHMPIVRGVKPYRHQIRAFNLGVSIPCMAILHEQGVGKTLAAIAIMGHRAKADGVRRVLVVAPVSVVPVWVKEITALLDLVDFRVTALEGSSKDKAAQVRALGAGRLEIVVVNYEGAWRDPLDDALRAWRPEMIICDESQRIKNPSAAQSKFMHELGRRARYKLILTGTPVMNTPLDFFSQYKFLDERIFGPSYYAFRARYAIMAEIAVGARRVKMIVGSQNLGELVQKAHSIASRVTKKQCLDLPETVDQMRYFDLDKKALKVYRELSREMAAEVREGRLVVAQHVLTRLLALSRITGGFVTTVDADGRERVEPVGDRNAKLELFEETLGDLLEAGKKVVVFVRFRRELEAVAEVTDRLTKAKDGVKGWRLLYGDTPHKERGALVEAFQTDPRVRVFIAQIQTADVGLTLHAADTAIFYSVDYSFGRHEQARARIHRVGQRNTCTYIYLVARGTIDEDVLTALKNKQDIARLVVDEWQTLLDKG